MRGALSDERTGLSFTIATGSRQRSHSRVRESWPYFTVSNSRLTQPGGPGHLIYIPWEQGDPVIPSGTGFPFRRLLRLAERRWRYSASPPCRWMNSQRTIESLRSLGTDRIENASPNCSTVASRSYPYGPHREHRFSATPSLRVMMPLPRKGYNCRAVPQQRLSSLASQFLLWANMPHKSLSWAIQCLKCIYSTNQGTSCFVWANLREGIHVLCNKVWIPTSEWITEYVKIEFTVFIIEPR
jgi:hypothetical protein